MKRLWYWRIVMMVLVALAAVSFGRRRVDYGVAHLCLAGVAFVMSRRVKEDSEHGE